MPIKLKAENLKIADIKTLQKKAALFDKLVAIIQESGKNALDKDLNASLKEITHGKIFGPYRSGNELKKALRA